MRWLRALALLAVPRDWRETVRGDLAADLARDDARRLSTGRYIVEAIRVGARLRWRDRRVPAPVAFLDSLRRLPFELRLALRSLRRAPWFTATVVGVMTLVLTLATTVFAIVDGVLFRPLPYPESEQLFVVEPSVNGYPPPEGFYSPASAADIGHWSAAAPEVRFTGFSAANWSQLGTGVNDDTAAMASVRADFFDVIGVRPIRGGFTSADFDTAGSIYPVIITWDVWQGRFHGAADIVGHIEYFRGSDVAGIRVVGIMPRGFWFPAADVEVQFIKPEVIPPGRLTDPTLRSFRYVVARVPVGMTSRELGARVEAGMAAAAAVFPDRGPKPDAWSDSAWRRDGPYDRATVQLLARSLGERSRPLFMAVFVASMVLLLLGALNASALLASRSFDRQSEVAVRRALGAPSRAIGQAVVVETLVLFVTAAAFAVLLAVPLVRTVMPLLPENTVLFKPWGADVFDLRVYAFAALAACVFALQASSWPVWRAVRSLTAAAGTVGRGSEERRLGRAVVVATQTAGALTLTVLGALLVGSLLSVYGRSLPIRTDGIIYVEARLPGTATDRAARVARAAPILERLRHVQGVHGVTLIAGQTLFGAVPAGTGGGIFIKDDAEYAVKSPHTHAVTAGYYQILKPEVVAGRLPTDAELDAAAPLAVVTERLAEAYWPGEIPLGRTLRAVWDDERPYEVIGVVRDTPWLAWDTETPMAFGPYASLAPRSSTVTFFIDAADAPAQVTRAVLAELEAMTPAVTARRAGNLIDVFSETVNARRFRSWLFGGFAASALVVVGVGILGLLAMSTARRTREVGIRQALGATPASIVRLFLREQMRPVVAGLVIGGALSLWAVRFVESYLFGVTTTDPRVWTAAVLLILITAGAGALIPSLRASTIDPTISLRAD